MMWPTLIVDNFFNDPHKVITFSKQFKYKRDSDSAWPGTRTALVNELDQEFFSWSTTKIMSLLFPMNIEQIKWRARQNFQKIPYKTYGKKGWVHRDEDSECRSISRYYWKDV